MSNTLVPRSASPARKTTFSSRVSVRSPAVAPTNLAGPSSLPSVCQEPLIIGSPARPIKRLKSSKGPEPSFSSQSESAVALQLPPTLPPPCIESLATLSSGHAVSRYPMVDAFTNAPLPTRCPATARIPRRSFWPIPILV